MTARTGAVQTTPDAYLPDVARALKSSYAAAGRAPRTALLHESNLLAFSRFLLSTGRSDDPDTISAMDVEDFIVLTRTTASPMTALSKFISLKASFNWMRKRGLTTNEPFRGIDRPTVDLAVKKIMTADEARRIIAVTEGSGIVKRRDRAMLLLAADSGLRRSEMAAAQLANLDLAAGRLLLRGTKANRDRQIALSAATALAMRRWLVERVRLLNGRDDPGTLFLSRYGRPLTGFGVGQVFSARAKEAGVILDKPCHAWRSFFAVEALANGAGELAVMLIAGWRSNQMLRLYAGDQAASLALDAHGAFSPVSGLDR